MPRSEVLNFLMKNNQFHDLSTNIWGENADAAVAGAVRARNIVLQDIIHSDVIFSIEEKVSNSYSTDIIGINKNINFPEIGPSAYLNRIQVFTLTHATLHNWFGYHVVFEKMNFSRAASSVYAPLHLFNELKLENSIENTEESIAVGFVCFDDSDPSNYCHFLLDYLTKIALYKFIRPKLTIVMPPIAGHSFQLEALKRLQLDGIEIVTVKEGSSIKADLLFYIGKNSQYSHPAFKGSHFSITYLQKLFLPNRAVSVKSNKLLWISRSKSRSIKNQDDILRKFKDKIDIFDLDRYPISVTQQAELFSNYRGIIGPHGAGFTNIIFMNNDEQSTAIECFAEGNGIPTFAILSTRLNIRHCSIILSAIDTGISNYPDMLLNESDFDSCLNQLM
jgi:hypothetical protein